MADFQRDILIIDDSKAVCILIKDFLQKLGFTKTHFCENGETGIRAFRQMYQSGITPIVFLDYNLPDMSADSVMTQLLRIQPDVKVILETAKERSDEVVKDVISQGAYQYLPKPIRLDNLKNVMDTLAFEEQSSQTISYSSNDTLLELIKQTSPTSLTRLSQYSKKSKDELVPILDELIKEKKIVALVESKEIECPDCGSVMVNSFYYCPSCKSSNFKREKLIEHYECGNISSHKSYVDDNCPKCRKKIKVLGADYRALENFYTCNQCNERFPELSYDFLCTKCNNRFKIERAKWSTSPIYKVL